jgi:hypothetical protein
LIYDDKIKANLLNKYFCSISYGHAWSYYLPYYDGICTYV